MVEHHFFLKSLVFILILQCNVTKMQEALAVDSYSLSLTVDIMHWYRLTTPPGKRAKRLRQVVGFV
jgi:hypothetical protein